MTSSCLSSERLQREKEIAEERAERRLEILKNLVNNNGTETATMNSAEDGTKVYNMHFHPGCFSLADILLRIIFVFKQAYKTV